MRIWEFSSLIGTLTSTFPGNKFGPLYYQELDKCKTLGLKKGKGNFDMLIKLLKEAILDLQRWIFYSVKKATVPRYYKNCLHGYTNALVGAYCEGISTGGWLTQKRMAYKCSFFSIWIFFHDHSWITGLLGKGEDNSLTPHYYFHPLHRHLDISI